VFSSIRRGCAHPQTSEANCRQLVQRAKQHVAAGRPRFVPAPGAADDLAKRFLDACTRGEVDDLLTMLADDAMAWADGGGKFSAARRPIAGADKVARFVASVVQKWRVSGDVRVAPVSGGIGLLLHVAGVLRAVMTVEIGEDRVRGVFVVVNPEKLIQRSTFPGLQG
jgi:RNA polymerase sigma-70 factor (ECF subfamily)